MEKDNSIVQQIIHKWMENYPPADREEQYRLLLTSYEIAEILGEFGAIDAGDVTRELLQAGYSLTRAGEGQIKWIIKKGSNG